MRDRIGPPDNGSSASQAPVRRTVDPRSSGRLIMNLGTSVVIKGELSASEDLILYGRMEGRVTLSGRSADLSRDDIHKAYFGADRHELA